MLKSLEINGFKSFANKSQLRFDAAISAIVGPNGSGKSNAAEAFRFVLGEQSLKTLRARHSDELLYNGGEEGQRRNRASVKAVFDNSDGLLNIDYKEVVIERLIQRGNASTYRVNGSQVRLKDVVDLLADANIGTSRHHIISQGESDRILNVHERDRKSIIEDALGLGRFYRQQKEAVGKLERTQKNLEEIESHRQELMPELRFLTKQKRRIEETKKLREELTEKYQVFFKREGILLSHREKLIEEKITKLSDKKAELIEKISATEKVIPEKGEQESVEEGTQNEIKEINNLLTANEDKLATTFKELGQIEGKLQAFTDQKKRSDSKKTLSSQQIIKQENLFRALLDEVEAAETDAKKLGVLSKITKALREFLYSISSEENTENSTNDDGEVTALKKEKESIEKKQTELKKERADLQEKKEALQASQRASLSNQHEAEKQLLELTGLRKNTVSELERLHEQRNELMERKEQLEDEKSEARILCGKEALETDNIVILDSNGEEVSVQEFLEYTGRREEQEFNRQLERLKIRLENTRVGDQTEVLKEFERVQSRIDFLEKEMSDLQESKDSLLVLINEIEETVAEKFTAGVSQINKAFNEFFQTMFGGGSAKIFITKHPEGKRERVEEISDTAPEEELEEGIAITVSLPKKKIKGLGVLSGGERSLVSIALLFALSQINPPPFIVLDEADAALDEANSQRFGDMIHKLSKRSQLIVITHNRETMTRADMLYGVTMDQSGGSRLLSLNFNEAVDVVKE